MRTGRCCGRTRIFLRGDSLGLLTARFVNADAVVTPVTSNTAIRAVGLFAKVYRTRVGSPFVIEGMQTARQHGFRRVVGFEANGGVLLGSSVRRRGPTGPCAPHPRRDAADPECSRHGGERRRSGFALHDILPPRYTRSGRIEMSTAEQSAPFLQGLLMTPAEAELFCGLGTIKDSDAIDGVRVMLSTGEVIHYRASGNAPELRCYAEAASARDVRTSS